MLPFSPAPGIESSPFSGKYFIVFVVDSEKRSTFLPLLAGAGLQDRPFPLAPTCSKGAVRKLYLSPTLFLPGMEAERDPSPAGLSSDLSVFW